MMDKFTVATAPPLTRIFQQQSDHHNTLRILHRGRNSTLREQDAWCIARQMAPDNATEQLIGVNHYIASWSTIPLFQTQYYDGCKRDVEAGNSAADQSCKDAYLVYKGIVDFMTGVFLIQENAGMNEMMAQRQMVTPYNEALNLMAASDPQLAALLPELLIEPSSVAPPGAKVWPFHNKIQAAMGIVNSIMHVNGYDPCRCAIFLLSCPLPHSCCADGSGAIYKAQLAPFQDPISFSRTSFDGGNTDLLPLPQVAYATVKNSQQLFQQMPIEYQNFLALKVLRPPVRLVETAIYGHGNEAPQTFEASSASLIKVATATHTAFVAGPFYDVTHRFTGRVLRGAEASHLRVK